MGAVIAAFDEHGFEQRAERQFLAGFEVELVWFDSGFGGEDCGDFVHAGRFDGDEGAEEFLGAGDGPAFVGIFFEHGGTGDGVDDDAGIGCDFRGWGESALAVGGSRECSGGEGSAA
jgi:hypothetical protein